MNILKGLENLSKCFFRLKIELSWSTASDAGVYSLLLGIECASLLQFNSSCLGWCYKCKVNFPKYYSSNSLNLSNNHRIKYTLNISNFCFIINQFCAVIFFLVLLEGMKRTYCNIVWILFICFKLIQEELNKYLWLSSEVWVALVSLKGDICFKAEVQLSLVSRLQKELNFSIWEHFHCTLHS